MAGHTQYIQRPNGWSDTWKVIPDVTVQIYNRYGQMVERFVNYANPWDGKINGQDAPIGTYYYIIDPKTEEN